MIDAKQKKSATRFVLLTVFAYSVGFGIIMPVLPNLIVELEGVSLSEATLIGGFIAAAYAVFQFLLGPFVGNLGDRFGRRPVFLFSLGGFTIDFFLMGFAPSIIWLFIGRSIAGGLGAIFGPANATMADISSEEERAKSFGMVGAAFGIGFIVGPALGGLLGEFGTRVPFFVAAAIAGVAFIYGYFAFPETMDKSKRREFSLKRANPIGAFMSLNKLSGVVGIAFIYFIWVTSTNIYPVSWSYFAQIKYEWSTRMVGFSLALVGLSMALVQALVIGRVVAKFGERVTAAFGLAFATAAMLCYALIESANFALGFCLIVGLQGVVMPSLNAMMSRRTPADSQGELQGFNGSLAALAALIAPLIYNTTLFYYTNPVNPVFFPGAPFILSASIAFIALISLLRVEPTQRPLDQNN
ncbi:tetracycline resistance MFS efflux pump [Arenicella sp. 4NH20-0111]|uniref:TCR/Tet family MFS transporter n=1 Tax=Arenicella sp. 4NH20-0111 TaxID=3127648 RepID=UPI003101F04E